MQVQRPKFPQPSVTGLDDAAPGTEQGPAPQHLGAGTSQHVCEGGGLGARFQPDTQDHQTQSRRRAPTPRTDCQEDGRGTNGACGQSEEHSPQDSPAQAAACDIILEEQRSL